jgi:hypothetical protein
MAIQMVQVLLIVGREMGSVFVSVHHPQYCGRHIVLLAHRAPGGGPGQRATHNDALRGRRARCALRAQLTK